MENKLKHSIEKGCKVFKDLPISDAHGNTTILPYFIIRGEQDGPTLCITSGVHGTEYPGIAASLKLYQELDVTKLAGTIIGCPMCNYEAFVARSMFVNPLDQKNLNHVFPGNPQGTITDIIATTLLTEFVSWSDYHIDMHSGDSIEHLYPYVFYHKSHNETIDEISKQMAEAYALDYVAVTELFGSGASDRGNFYSSSSEHGIPCIQPEIGGIGLVEEKTKMLHYQGVINVLVHLNMLLDYPITTCENAIPLESFFRLYSKNNGVFYSYVSPGEKIVKGQLLATITDYHGEVTLETFTAKDNGVVLWVMSSLATKNADTLMAIGVIHP